MERDNSPVRGATAPDDGEGPRPARLADGDWVMAAYDDVDGTSAFVVAAIDSDGAWIAVPAGVELDLFEWR